MGRTVSALVTCDDDYLGAVGPFGVDIPWWAEAEPVAARLREVLGVPVIVLRLLRVDGGDGSRDGHVTYHVAALSRPAPGLLADGQAVPADVRAELDVTDERRSPWARLDGVLELLGWASDVLAAARRHVTGAAVQRKAWNLAALFRLPTGPAPVWLKATPRFAADEASVIAAFAHVDPALVPPVIGTGPGRVLLEHLPGEDCWDASPGIIASAVGRLVTAQAWSACVPGCDPARALRIAAPLAHLAYAVRYQEFLDGIEPSERVYHRGDPAAAIRAALRSAANGTQAD